MQTLYWTIIDTAYPRYEELCETQSDLVLRIMRWLNGTVETWFYLHHEWPDTMLETRKQEVVFRYYSMKCRLTDYVVKSFFEITVYGATVYVWVCSIMIFSTFPFPLALCHTAWLSAHIY